VTLVLVAIVRFKSVGGRVIRIYTDWEDAKKEAAKKKEGGKEGEESKKDGDAGSTNIPGPIPGSGAKNASPINASPINASPNNNSPLAASPTGTEPGEAVLQRDGSNLKRRLSETSVQSERRLSDISFVSDMTKFDEVPDINSLDGNSPTKSPGGRTSLGGTSPGKSPSMVAHLGGRPSMSSMVAHLGGEPGSLPGGHAGSPKKNKKRRSSLLKLQRDQEMLKDAWVGKRYAILTYRNYIRPYLGDFLIDPFWVLVVDPCIWTVNTTSDLCWRINEFLFSWGIEFIYFRFWRGFCHETWVFVKREWRKLMGNNANANGNGGINGPGNGQPGHNANDANNAAMNINAGGISPSGQRLPRTFSGASIDSPGGGNSRSSGGQRDSSSPNPSSPSRRHGRRSSRTRSRSRSHSMSGGNFSVRLFGRSWRRRNCWIELRNQCRWWWYTNLSTQNIIVSESGIRDASEDECHTDYIRCISYSTISILVLYLKFHICLFSIYTTLTRYWLSASARHWYRGWFMGRCSPLDKKWWATPSFWMRRFIPFFNSVWERRMARR
jgi:hypothetical protein